MGTNPPPLYPGHFFHDDARAIRRHDLSPLASEPHLTLDTPRWHGCRKWRINNTYYALVRMMVGKGTLTRGEMVPAPSTICILDGSHLFYTPCAVRPSISHPSLTGCSRPFPKRPSSLSSVCLSSLPWRVIISNLAPSTSMGAGAAARAAAASDGGAVAVLAGCCCNANAPGREREGGELCAIRAPNSAIQVRNGVEGDF